MTPSMTPHLHRVHTSFWIGVAELDKTRDRWCADGALACHPPDIMSIHRFPPFHIFRTTERLFWPKECADSPMTATRRHRRATQYRGSIHVALHRPSPHSHSSLTHYPVSPLAYARTHARTRGRCDTVLQCRCDCRAIHPVGGECDDQGPLFPFFL